MSSLSTSLYGASTSKGVGGLLSGLDTEDLVKQMTAATRNKINKQYQAKQKLLYRQEAYREISTKMISFNNKYFSYASGSKTNILSPNFFQSYTFKSSSNYVNVTGNAENIKNFSIDSISSVATAASFASSKKVTSGEFTSKEITELTSSLAGETFSLDYEGTTYNFTIPKDFGKGNDEVELSKVVKELNIQLATMKDKEDKLINGGNEKLSFKVEDNKIVFDKGTAKLTAASTDFHKVLNMTVGEEAVSGEINEADLTRTAEQVMLEGSITFEFNGVLKTFKLSDMETGAYTYDAKGLSEFLQDKLDKEFGAGKVKVDGTGNNLTFKAENASDIFGVSSVSKELSSFTGIESGDYNRINRNKAINDAGLAGLSGNDTYKISINGAEIDIEGTMSITDIINKINSHADAGVKVSYSSTTNTFSVKATETGEHKSVVIKDVDGNGNLAETLFGSSVDSKLRDGEFLKTEEDGTTSIYKLESGTETKVADIKYSEETKKHIIEYTDGTANIEDLDYIVNKGTDTKMTYTLNGVQNTVTRSTANFTIDEINIELNEKASTIDFTKNAVTFDVTNNSDEVVERVKQFIDEYNEIISLIATKTSERPKRSYLPLTPEQQEEMKEEEIKNWTIEAKKGILYGDSKMNNVLRSMREAMSGFTDVSSLTLSSIGISSASMDTSGKLVLDEKKFKEKLLENPDEIANLFTSASSKGEEGTSGIALQLQQILNKNVGAYGTTGLLIDEAGMSNSMTSDSNYISERIVKYDDKMADLKKALEAERQRYWNQFSALEQALNKLNAQSSWLTDMMG